MKKMVVPKTKNAIDHFTSEIVLLIAVPFLIFLTEALKKIKAIKRVIKKNEVWYVTSFVIKEKDFIPTIK